MNVLKPFYHEIQYHGTINYLRPMTANEGLIKSYLDLFHSFNVIFVSENSSNLSQKVIVVWHALIKAKNKNQNVTVE